MKTTININGKDVEITLTAEQVAQIKAESATRTGYERVGIGERYYYADEVNIVSHYTDDDSNYDTTQYENANYFTDKKLAESVARARRLQAQLDRFAVEENAKAGIVLDWEDSSQCKYYIYYDYIHKTTDLNVHFSEWCRSISTPYFATLEIAEKAIEQYRDELMWYFTEFKNYVEEK